MGQSLSTDPPVPSPASPADSPSSSPPASPTDSPSPSPPSSPTQSIAPLASPTDSQATSPTSPPSYALIRRSIQAQSMKPLTMDGRKALERAVREMKECKDVFASWRRFIDSSISGKPCDLERQIRTYIDKLENSALNALRESENIVEAHTVLGLLMSRRLDTASPHDGSVTLHGSPEVIVVIEEIQRRSEAVSEHADRMKDLLRGLVDLLERGAPKKKTLSQKLFGWLRKILHVVAIVLSALSAASLTAFQIAAPALAAGSAIAKAAAAIAGDLENGSPEKFEKMLALLRDIIPAQANIVAQKLSDFQYCHLILQHEMEMQRGVVYQLDSREADHARLQWATHNMGMQHIRF